jgi:hypothetical protein
LRDGDVCLKFSGVFQFNVSEEGLVVRGTILLRCGIKALKGHKEPQGVFLLAVALDDSAALKPL